MDKKKTGQAREDKMWRRNQRTIADQSCLRPSRAKPRQISALLCQVHSTYNYNYMSTWNSIQYAARVCGATHCCARAFCLQKNLHVAVRACKFPLERLARLIDYRAVRALADMCSGETRRRPVLWRALVHGGAQYLVPARDWETTNDLISGRDSGNVHARTCPRGAAAQRAAPVRARALLSGTRSPHAG